MYGHDFMNRTFAPSGQPWRGYVVHVAAPADSEFHCMPAIVLEQFSNDGHMDNPPAMLIGVIGTSRTEYTHAAHHVDRCPHRGSSFHMRPDDAREYWARFHVKLGGAAATSEVA